MTRLEFWTVLSIINYAGVLIAIEHLVRTRRDPRGAMAWIMALLLLPVAGLLLFLLIGEFPIQRKVRRRRRRRRQISAGLARQLRALTGRHDASAEQEVDTASRHLMRIARVAGDAIVTRGNDVLLLQDAERTFLMLSLAIEAAQHHIHLEYYIFANDETGRAIGRQIAAKAAQGVEVRLLLDAVGCWRLPRSFVRELRRAGVEVEFFLPWGFTSRRFHVNCRNHRKIAVIDGRDGFLGSQNIGDAYLGRLKKYGPWRDSHLRVRGPAVAQLQEVFVEDWHFSSGRDLTADAYFPEASIAGAHRVQIVPSGPDGRPDVLHQLFYAALSEARESVCLLTPYFVPDRAMLIALQSAALRGVRVRLLLPARSDHRIVLWAARGHYDELIESGVEVYEFPEGMLHSKVVVVDERWAMLGSANMDERSFRINFEVTAILYDTVLARSLHADFDELRARSIRQILGLSESWSYAEKLAAGVARLATPLL